MSKPHRARAAVGVAAAGATLVAAAFALAPAAAAESEHVTLDQIGADDAPYLGWHFEQGTGVDRWNGIELGGSANSYLLNGLVGTGAPGVATTGDDLGTLITGAAVVGSGTGVLEVPVTVGGLPTNDGMWATLRAAENSVGDEIELSDNWVSSKKIELGGAVIPANTRIPLGDILDQLDVAGDVRYSGFGVYTSAPTTSVISSIAFGDSTTTFGRVVSPIDAGGTEYVTTEDIRAYETETEYVGWHESDEDPEGSYEVTEAGLAFGGPADSNIMNGFETPIQTDDVFSLLASYSITVASGEAYSQVPLFYGEPVDGRENFTTLRAYAPFTGAASATELSDQWTVSRTIAATGTTPEIVKNQAYALGDILEAIDAHGSVRVLAVGALALKAPEEPAVATTLPGTARAYAAADATAVVSDISFNGVTYSFLAEPVDDDADAATDADATTDADGATDADADGATDADVDGAADDATDAADDATDDATDVTDDATDATDDATDATDDATDVADDATDADNSENAPVDDAESGSGELAVTGATVSIAAGIGGFAVLLAGIVLVALRRRANA